METENEAGAKVDFSGDTHPEKNRGSQRRIKIAFAVLIVSLLAAAATGTLAFFLKKRPPTRLVEVSLEEGDTMTYQVDQTLAIQGEDDKHGTIGSVVKLRVLNRTSDDYWFFMKIIIRVDKGDENTKILDSSMEQYFLVKLRTSSRSNSLNETDESIELYGSPNMDGKLVHYVYGVLQQLLPALTRDLYEDVDGEKSEPIPEKSPLLPGAVKMHRSANTSDKNSLFIKNHFTSADIAQKKSEIHMDVSYVGSASVNKSTGMVSESLDYVSEHLNFGEGVRSKNGSELKEVDIVFFSRVILVRGFEDLSYEEIESVKLHLFRKLTVASSSNTVDVRMETGWLPTAFKSSDARASDFNGTDGQRNSTLPVHARLRRSLMRKKRQIRRPIPIVTSYTLFEKKVLGISIAAEGKAWVEFRPDRALTQPDVGVNVTVKLGIIDVPVFHYKYPADATNKPSEIVFSKKVPVGEIPVFGPFTVGAEFLMTFRVSIALNLTGFPLLKIEPFAEVVTDIIGFGSVQVFVFGVMGRGTLMKASLPLKLSQHGLPDYVLIQAPPRRLYPHLRGSAPLIEQVQTDLSPNLQTIWCLSLSADLTALELSAAMVYKRWRCPSWRLWECELTPWQIYKVFGKWAAIKKNWEVFNTC